MLKPTAPGVAIVACSTCRRPSHEAATPDADGSDGERLVAALRAVRASDARYAAIAIETMPCLFACSAACTLHLRAPGKIGYVLGGFAPDEAAARAILDYAAHYAASAEGEVRYADWPEGVKGHFLTRCPPQGFTVA